MTVNRLTVQVHPSASRDACVARGGGRFEIWVRAKPVEGRATDAVRAQLAHALGIVPSRLRLVGGVPRLRSGRRPERSRTDGARSRRNIFLVHAGS